LIWKECENTKSLILIEDIDLFFPRHGQETRDTSLAACLNELVQQNKLMLVATTRRPDHVALDIRVLFQDEVILQIPTPKERFYIMKHIYQSSFNLADIKESQIQLLSSKAHAFVAADLAQWCRLAEEDAIVQHSNQGIS
jgi:SpoVK/Ycf46/Vps4 family AAA+-type ATPase